jgi:hypothetical protein
MNLIVQPTRRLIKPRPGSESQLDRSHPLTQGLVGAWLMNEGAGSVVQDVSGNQNHGIGTGIDWSADLYGPATLFTTSSTDKITLSKSITSSQNGSTIVFLGRLNSVGPKMLVGKAGATNNQIYAYDATRIRLYAAGTTSDWTADKSFNTRLRLYVFVGSGAGWTLYLDGKSQGYVSNDNALTWDLIGYGSNNTAYTWNGTITYVSAYSRALSASEIASLYAGP